MPKFEEKFKSFLESLGSKDSELMGTIIRGFDIVFNPEESGNPYGLSSDYDKPDLYYDVRKDRIRQFCVCTPEQEKIIKKESKRLNITPEDIKEEYLIYHAGLTMDEFLSLIQTFPYWKELSYYNDDEHKYYVKSKKKYATGGGEIDNQAGGYDSR